MIIWGNYIDISANCKTVAIGDFVINSAHVIVYKNIGDSWIQVDYDIYGENVYDKTGHCDAIYGDGDTLAQGAHYNGGNINNSGYVRVYYHINYSWLKIGDDID